MATRKTPGLISDKQLADLVEKLGGLREGFTSETLRARVSEAMNAYRFGLIIDHLDATLRKTEKELRSLASASQRMLRMMARPGVWDALVAEANVEGEKGGGWPGFPPDLIHRPGDAPGKDFHGEEKVSDLAEKVRNLGEEVSNVMEKVGSLGEEVQLLHDLAESAASRYAGVAASRKGDSSPRGPRRTRRETFQVIRQIYEDATGRQFTVNKRADKAPPSGPGIDLIQACFALVEEEEVSANTIDGWHRETLPR